jgi:hypothetical protein
MFSAKKCVGDNKIFFALICAYAGKASCFSHFYHLSNVFSLNDNDYLSQLMPNAPLILSLAGKSFAVF